MNTDLVIYYKGLVPHKLKKEEWLRKKTAM
jgi:hypothetical protein